LFVRLLQLARTGCDEAARALFRQLSPLIDLMFAEPNPAPVKAALALAGLARAEVRQPLTPATRALTARLEAAMALLPPAVFPPFPPSSLHIPTATGKMPDCLKNVHHVT
jgi:4-hydroxy-tetrahydrodipicolinate synthase